MFATICLTQCTLDDQPGPGGKTFCAWVRIWSHDGRELPADLYQVYPYLTERLRDGTSPVGNQPEQ